MSAADDMFRHRQVSANGSSLHVVEAGDPAGKPFLFLHGWPESWYSWRSVMRLASRQAHAIAIDLPGIGESTGGATDGSKRTLAETVHHLVATLRLHDLTLIGQDIGGMIAYSYLRSYDDIARAVIMDVVIPGIDPWAEVLRNPYIWHFALHATPKLPEHLVQGRQSDYFDYFYDILSHDSAKITADARAAYTNAYSSDAALTAGFNWYRAFQRDAEENKPTNNQQQVATPLLYLRGEHESGDINAYVDGFRAAGLAHVEHAIVPSAGHFTQEEAPEAVWRMLADFCKD